MGIDPFTLDARRLLNLRYSMLFGPMITAERADYLHRIFDWPPTREEWGATPEALAAQDALAGSLPGLDVDD